jgi:hypothetical protein
MLLAPGDTSHKGTGWRKANATLRPVLKQFAAWYGLKAKK